MIEPTERDGLVIVHETSLDWLEWHNGLEYAHKLAENIAGAVEQFDGRALFLHERSADAVGENEHSTARTALYEVLNDQDVQDEDFEPREGPPGERWDIAGQLIAERLPKDRLFFGGLWHNPVKPELGCLTRAFRRTRDYAEASSAHDTEVYLCPELIGVDTGKEVLKAFQEQYESDRTRTIDVPNPDLHQTLDERGWVESADERKHRQDAIARTEQTTVE